jgi:trimeric autotransporter adhesin
MPYTINGCLREGIAEPVLLDDTTFVPVGTITDLLGGYVTFDNMTKVATIEHGSNKARLQADNSEVELNGTMETLQAAPYIEDNTMWVPVRFFSNLLGATLNVEGDHITLSTL